ncbi:hypothetical protein BJ166DRAFT_507356 [Pestalotiopsis sp. NC0098]|nr:hypothetical protein BJ166DRAFT_507356 [Pestalotiopsis sp. NC0098]
MPPMPLLLSPALPVELLTYIQDHHICPTTLIICSTRSQFLEALQQDIRKQDVPHQIEPEDANLQEILTQDIGAPPPGQKVKQNDTEHDLLSQKLSQLAISRHIRTVHIPTVTHLRSYMSVFVLEDSKVPPPPANSAPRGRKPPSLVVYGVIEMHRDTSEWSAQGLGSTMAVLVETASRLGWSLVVIEPVPKTTPRTDHGSDVEDLVQPMDRFEDLLKEKLPILSGSVRRGGLDLEEGGWSSRTVEVGRVMSRWFGFQRGVWDIDNDDNGNIKEAK